MNLKNLSPWLGLILGIILSCALAILFKESPLHVLKVLGTSFMSSKYDLGLTLFYTTCLIFSSLAFALPMKTGLFHIGSEGQIVISAFITAMLGYLILPLSFFGATFFSVFFLILCALLTGAFSAALIAVFKIYKQAHEVVVAIMLNFILAAVATWATVNKLQSSTSQNPETEMLQQAFQFMKNDPLKLYFEQSPVSLFLILALLSCGALYVIEKHTVIGLQFRSFGVNPHAAERLGLSAKKILTASLALAGAFSACVGLTEVLGNTFQYKIGFSPQYGFLGIAVSLLARQNFLGIIGSAFLMACLHKGASDLDLETTYLTRDFSRVLQAIIIFSVAASYYIFNRKRGSK